MKAFLSELRRRRVTRVAALYLVAGWATIQVADVVFPRLALPAWTVTLVVALVALGLPLALVLAWAFDVTADGVRRDPGPAIHRGTHRAAGWLALGILTGLIGFGGYAYLGPRTPDGAELDAARIAVLPFEVRAGPELHYLREAFVDLLSAKLNHAGELTSVDPAALLAALGDEPGVAIDPGRARNLALRFRAGEFILGSILRLGGSLEIHARLYGADAEVIASATVSAREEDLAAAVDELARRLLANRLRGPATELARAAATSTRSLPALRAFLQGEAKLRRGDAEGAVRSFEEAVGHDPSFTYAHFRLGVARSWRPRSSQHYAATLPAIERALAGAQQLPERERTLVRLFAAYWTGSAQVAETLAWKALSREPENLEARYYLGEVLFHNNAAQGRDLQEAREPFEQVLALQPDHPFALIHLADLALARGDATALDSLGARITGSSPDLEPHVRAYRVVLAGTRGADPAADADADALPHSLAAALAGVPAEMVSHIAWRATALTRSADVARAFAGVLENAGDDPAVRATTQEIRAAVEAVAGRWDAALAALGPSVETESGALFTAMLLLAGGDDAPNDALGRAARALARTPSDELGRGDIAASDVLHLYARGRIALALGDSAAFQASLRALDAMRARAGQGHVGGGSAGTDDVATRDPRDLPGYHATALRAHQEALEGRPASAAALLRDSLQSLLLPHEAFLMARLLESEQRPADAARWYRGLRAFDNSIYQDLPLIERALALAATLD